MSKRVPDSGFTLDDSPSAASRRVLTAFTGGRATTEEQRRLGGRADICPVYDLYRFHFAKDDDHVKLVYHECTKGIRLCGECKEEAAGLVKTFLQAHDKKRDSMMKDAEILLKKSREYLGSTGR
jgi:tryptophanyl-tRNA synthetase